MLFNRCADYIAAINRLWVLDNHASPEVVIDLDKIAFINDARDEAAMELLCIPREESISWPAGTASQNIVSADIFTIDKLFWEKDELDNIQTRGEYYDYKLELATGTPKKFYIHEDLKTIFLYPTPTIGAVLSVFGFAVPENIMNTDFSLDLTANLTAGSTTISGGTLNTSTLEVGMEIAGSHIISGTTISELISTTSLRMSAEPTDAATGETITFTKTALAVETEIPIIARRAILFYALSLIYDRDPFNEDTKAKAQYYLQKFNGEMGKAKARTSRAKHLGKAGSVTPR
jgi:hypothetical protein